MSNRDSRSRAFDTRLKAEQERHKEELASHERKWEFRYNNQRNTIRELEATVKDLRKKNRALRKELKNE